jgi:hypothetical protein
MLLNKALLFLSISIMRITSPCQLHNGRTHMRSRSGRYSELVISIQKQGVKAWQFEQAICNLLLSTALCGRLFYRTLPPETLTAQIAQALRTREENSETPEPTQFVIHDVLNQVRLDGIQLLGAAGRLSPHSCSLNTIQKQLAYLKLLEHEDA